MPTSPSHPVAGALASVTLGPSVTVGSLTSTPLIGDDDPACVYITLDQALFAGAVEVTEVSDAGSVPELRVRNRGDRAVLIIDGEELIGAKQNRVINLSVLVAPQTDTTIPVSCVEAGRWRHQTRQFSSAPRTQFASGRAAKMSQVSQSMVASGSRSSDQGAIWEVIALKSDRMDAPSETSSMAAIYERHATPLDVFVQHLQPVSGQRGSIYSIGGQPRGLELFDRAETFFRLAPKLVRSYAIDAMEVAVPQPAQPGDASVREFLAIIRVLDPTTFPAVGLGQDVRLAGTGAVGAALVAHTKIVHLAAFAEGPYGA